MSRGRVRETGVDRAAIAGTNLVEVRDSAQTARARRADGVKQSSLGTNSGWRQQCVQGDNIANRRFIVVCL